MLHFVIFFIATNRIYFTLFRVEELIERCFNSYFSFWIKKRNLKKGNFVGHNTLPWGRLGGPGPAPAPPPSDPGGWAGPPPPPLPAAILVGGQARLPAAAAHIHLKAAVSSCVA